MSITSPVTDPTSGVAHTAVRQDCFLCGESSVTPRFTGWAQPGDTYLQGSMSAPNGRIGPRPWRVTHDRPKTTPCASCATASRRARSNAAANCCGKFCRSRGRGQTLRLPAVSLLLEHPVRSRFPRARLAEAYDDRTDRQMFSFELYSCQVRRKSDGTRRWPCRSGHRLV
jgi:hypothetical protein